MMDMKNSQNISAPELDKRAASTLQSSQWRPPLISPEKLAEQLGVTVETLATWRCTGRYNLPFVKIGRKPMYQPDVVDLWLQKRTIRPAAMDARC